MAPSVLVFSSGAKQTIPHDDLPGIHSVFTISLARAFDFTFFSSCDELPICINCNGD